MTITIAETSEGRVRPRSLPGATVLQMTPTLKPCEPARLTLQVSRALIHSGARAIVIAEPGDLADELRGFGGECLPPETYRAQRRQTEPNRLAQFVDSERVDIIHARDARAARQAVSAIGGTPAHLVTDLPDLAPLRMRLAMVSQSALARGDRVIARSLYSARPMIERHAIPASHVTVIPQAIDTRRYDPASVSASRVAALRHAWGIPSGVRVVLVPGPVGPAQGQARLVEVAALLESMGTRHITFVLTGDDRRHIYYLRRMMAKARDAGVAPLFRVVGECPDMAGAYAAADVVVASHASPPLHARAIAEAQSMARPVVVSGVGVLPEHVLSPPRVPADRRTGWVAEPGDPVAMARALAEALAMDATAYRSVAARAHAFAQAQFAPDHASAATLDVYRALLAQGG